MRVDVNGHFSMEKYSHSLQLEANNTVVSDDDDEMRKFKGTASISRQIFPQRLFTVLADSKLSDTIAWLPHGRSFVIIRPDVFSEQILPKYFPSNDTRSSTKYPSFTRKLNRWGFRQATRGPDTGAFHHPLFRRDQVELCRNMVCQKSRKRRNTKSQPKVAPVEPMVISPKTPTATPTAPPTPTNAAPTTLTAKSLAFLSANSTVRSASTMSQVSVDDKSVSSNMFPVASTALSITSAPSVPLLPKDPELVAKALKEREEREKLNVFRSILYDAYLQALKFQEIKR